MSRWLHRNLFFAMGSLLIIFAVLAEMEIVPTNGVDVHEKKFSMSAIVATLNQNDQIDVLERGSDGWMRLKVGDKEGYVREAKLEQPKNGGFADLLKASTFQAHAQASDPSASMAARGLRPGVVVYSQAKNYRPDGLDAMIDTHRAVAGARYDQFTQEGNVGPR